MRPRHTPHSLVSANTGDKHLSTQPSAQSASAEIAPEIAPSLQEHGQQQPVIHPSHHVESELFRIRNSAFTQDHQKSNMASSGHPTVVDAWISVLFIAAVGTVLIANALLLHGSADKTTGWFSWNALRYQRFVKGPLRGLGGSASSRSRSRSASISSVPPISGEPPPPPANEVVVCLSEPSCERVEWKERCQQWLRWDPNAATRNIVARWMEIGDEDSANK